MLSSVERARLIPPQPFRLRFPFQAVWGRIILAGQVRPAARPVFPRICFSRASIPGRKGPRESKTSFSAGGWQHRAVTQSGLFLWASTALPERKFMRSVAMEARVSGWRSTSVGRHNAGKGAERPAWPVEWPASNPAGPECVSIGFWPRD